MGAPRTTALIAASILTLGSLPAPVLAQDGATDPDCAAFAASRADVRALRRFIDRYGTTALQVLGLTDAPASADPEPPRSSSSGDSLSAVLRGPAGPIFGGVSVATFRATQAALFGRLLMSGGLAATTGLLVADNFLFPSTAGGDPYESSAAFIIRDPSLLYGFTDEVACDHIRATTGVRSAARTFSSELRTLAGIAAEQDTRWSEALRAEGINPESLGGGPALELPFFEARPAR